MTEPAISSADSEPVIFDALLTPNRSLTPQGFVILMSAVCAVSFLAGLAFFLVGAWPVVGFFSLDVLLIYLAFRINYHHGRRYESLVLTRDELMVQRVDPWGRASRWRFQPVWLQILMDDPPRHHSQLTLRSHGRSVAIGSFLTPAERLELARALRRALSDTRSAPRPA